ncbi:MAG: RluA family pseudouridine synthase [Betaproteobacteria bacterium]|nr:RluA family pseudouridine synthase [Betaproteobacteria bacterium]
MNELSKESTTWHAVGEGSAQQRIDNYLTKLLKGVPKSHIYRILRSGQVRVNSGRVGPDYRLQLGDRIRIPPVRVAQRRRQPPGGTASPIDHCILHEDEALLVLDKPAGVAVHGGSGISFGVVEQLRRAGPQGRFLELVHRLDRDTSGVLLLAKKRAALTALHAQLRTGSVQKFYLTLVRGKWRDKARNVKLPLNKYVLASGERRVSVAAGGLPSHTVLRLRQAWPQFSLLEAELKTGRTHQIRVHLAHLGFPIAGDDKYGDFALNKALAKQGLKRMFLHAWKTVVAHPVSGEPIAFEAPLPADLTAFLGRLDSAEITA